MHTTRNSNDITFGCGRTAPLDEIALILSASPDVDTAVATIVARFRVPAGDAHAVLAKPLWALLHEQAAS